MASCLGTHLILLAIFSLIYPAFGVSSKAITNICSKTQNPNACLDLLFSDPRTDSADLHQLLSIAISIAQITSQGHVDVLTLLKDKASNVKLKMGANIGWRYYQAIIVKLNEAYKLLESKEYKQSTKSLADALDLISKCGVEISRVSQLFAMFTYTMHLRCEIAMQTSIYIC
ncbi:hypothetical protein ACFE04_027720 [Oxalis oulophora]